MPRQGRKYIACPRCPGSWVFEDRLLRFPYCNRCYQAWPQGAGRQHAKALAPESPWEEATKPRRRTRSRARKVRYEDPEAPPGLQAPKTRAKDAPVTAQGHDPEIVKQVFAEASVEVQSLLRSMGMTPPAEEPPSLAALCQKHLDQMPDAIKEAMASTEPKQTPAQVTGAAGKALNKATAVLKGKVMQKVALQDRLNKSKAAYGALLQDMSKLDAELKVHQEEVTKCQKELEERVAEAPIPEPLQDLHTALKEAGLEATPEQVGLIIAKVRPPPDPLPAPAPADLASIVQGLQVELAKKQSTIDLLLAQVPQGQSVLLQEPVPIDAPMQSGKSAPPGGAEASAPPSKKDRSRSPKIKPQEVEG